MSEPEVRSRPWLRRMTGRDPDEAERASTPLELLFDLTLVVAVARAASELAHALAHGQAGHALAGYAVVFFALWWAWVNFTWFASAYDTDDVPDRRGSPGLFTAAAAGLLLVFALWWSYVKHSAVARLRDSLRWTFVWALGHYFIFAAVAALGAGLRVAVGALAHSNHVSAVFAAFAVAIPSVVFIVVYGLLSTHGWSADDGLTVLTAALILAAAAAAGVLTLPVSLVIMVALASLLLTYHLVRAARGAAQETASPAREGAGEAA
jgi:low temperature requirement protein LtrA